MDLATFWKKISHIGVRAGQVPEEQDRIIFSNRLYFLAAIGGLCLTLISAFGEQAGIHRLLNGSLAGVLMFCIMLNHWQYFYVSRSLAVFSISLVTGFAIILSAGNFAQGAIFASIVVVVFIFYSDLPQTRFKLIVGSSMVFIIAQCYLIYFPPLVEYGDVPYDETVVFLLAIVFIVWVLRIHDRQKSKLLEDMRAKNQNLQTLSKELERFAYIASHDLKSPLRTVSSFVGLLSKNIAEENFDEVQQNIAFVKKGVEQMSVTIDDILALSKIGSSQDLPSVIVDLNMAMGKAIRNLDDEILQKNAEVDVLQKLPQVRGHELDYVHLFQNLIQNGLKYNASQQPYIRISHKMEANNLSMSFEDNGIGIEEQYYEQIFEFFERLHHEAEYPGTGLGLALCQKIVHKNGGSISVQSMLDKGSTFTIVMPHRMGDKEYV